MRALKVSLNAAADAGQAVKFELVAAKQENERLQSNIVQVGMLRCPCGCLYMTVLLNCAG